MAGALPLPLGNRRRLRSGGLWALLLAALALTGGALTGCSEPGYRDGLHAYEAGKYDKAAAIWEPLAQAGHMRAQHQLGNLYRGGLGVGRDPARSFRWMRRAAEQGHAPSQFVLGYMLDEGLGVARDPARAFKWYRLAASSLESVPRRVEARRHAERLAGEIGTQRREVMMAEVRAFSPRPEGE